MNSLKTNDYSCGNTFGQWIIRTARALIYCAGLWGCQSQPINIEEKATENQWDITYQKGKHYPMVLLNSHQPARESTAHIYIEGDGLPWRSLTRISSDPTPRNAVALNLMKYDNTHAVYLGRPCYFGLQSDARCSQRLWTSGRYSEEVVDEMNQAITDYLEKKNLKYAVLVGYSGGGTLALLLANRNARIKGSLLIAPNFDIDAWVGLHGFTPLYESLNPAREVKKHDFKEIYWFGEKDENVPLIPFARAAKSRSQSEVRELANANHSCCWEDVARRGELAAAIQRLEH